MPALRPFSFSGLPRLTRPEVALVESLAVMLSYRPFTGSFRASLAHTLGEMVRAPVRIGRPRLRSIRRQELPALLPEVACLAVIGLAPSEHKVVVELDPNLAAHLIERLLGGDGSQVPAMLAPLSALEAGVLSFLLLHALRHFHDGWENGRELGLVLDRFAADLHQLGPALEVDDTLVQVQISASCGEVNGGLRIFLPSALVTRHFGSAPAQAQVTEHELAYMRRQLARLPEAQVTARLVAARVELSPVDIANVGQGDIIVLEQPTLRKTADGLEGELFVQLGMGKNGGFLAHLRNDASQAEQLLLEVVKIMVQEQPPEQGTSAEDAGDGGARPPDDNLGETAGLLRDIDAAVVVELGRLRLNTSQVVRLRAGQVLRLSRGPTDPVDLVVGNKIFARGELVEVEGELGVRLTQVAEADASA